jgi:hypothetical protein
MLSRLLNNAWRALPLAALLSIPAFAQAAEPTCPASLAVDETLKQSPEGWTQSRSDIPRRLSGITIFDGDPKELASLVGDQHKTSKTVLVSTWQFTPGTQYWMSCSYSGTRIVLSRPIPRNYRACAITYATDVSIDGQPEIRKVEWR